VCAVTIGRGEVKGEKDGIMRFKEILLIIIVAMIAFPILYVAMLFATGSLRLVYGFKDDKPDAKVVKVEEVRHTARRDSLAAANSKVFEALQKERADLKKEQERLAEQYARLEMLQAEIEKGRESLVSERGQLEKKMAETPALEDARFKKLAKIYQAMKPGEAAAILETIQDAQVAAILDRINDNKQKGKILSLLTKEKAVRINKLIK
jgi:flagellar motility protein MotE (MotC chaperone)